MRLAVQVALLDQTSEHTLPVLHHLIRRLCSWYCPQPIPAGLHCFYFRCQCSNL